MRQTLMSSRSFRLGVAALSIGVLAACSTSRGPAPIVNRTGVNAQPSVSAVPAPTEGAVVAGSGTTPATEAAVAETSQVRSPGGGIEVRPLESRSLDGGTAAGTGGRPPLPRLVKRPYSDTALAEMRAADAQTAAAASGPATAGTPAATPAPAAAAPAAAAGRVSGKGFAWPVNGKVTQNFADSRSLGITIDGQPGETVQAAADGKVIFSGMGPRGYGNLIIIKHDDDTVSVYGHNRALTVKEGQNVKRGQKVAEVGESGGVPNLLFEIRKSGKPVDPVQYLPKR